MTRQEHLDWAKQRALEYAQRGDIKNAVASMLSDLSKHPELERHAGGDLGMMMLMSGNMRDPLECERWIKGFN
jgi:hypothetical protein